MLAAATGLVLAAPAKEGTRYATARQYTVSTLLSVCLMLLVGAAPLAAAQAERRAPVTGAYIVVFRDGVASPGQLTRSLERLRGFRAARQFSLLNGFAARLTPAQAAALSADPQVAFVDVDRPIEAIGSHPLSAGDAAPTGVRRIDAATSEYAGRASGVNVAVMVVPHRRLALGRRRGHRERRAAQWWLMAGWPPTTTRTTRSTRRGTAHSPAPGTRPSPTCRATRLR